jgi:hypothetical protein
MPKRSMKVFTPDKSELMSLTSIRREGADLILAGKIMGTMPMKAVIRPEEARQALAMLDFKTILFLLTFLFRKSSSR